MGTRAVGTAPRQRSGEVSWPAELIRADPGRSISLPSADAKLGTRGGLRRLPQSARKHAKRHRRHDGRMEFGCIYAMVAKYDSAII